MCGAQNVGLIIVLLTIPVAGVTSRLAAAPQSAGSSTSSWDVPADARSRVNPVEATDAVLARALENYESRCLMCHGASGHGDGPAAITFQPSPPDIATAEARTRLTDGEIFFKISEGRRPMPRLAGRVPDDEIWGLVHYVRKLQAASN